MGTRADFYRDTENGLIWIASIAWDGYPEALYIKNKSEKESTRTKEVINTEYLMDCDSEEGYLEFLTGFLSGRDDVTYPYMGWPWPWENSNTTDFAYTFSREKQEVVLACFGRGWYNLKEFEELEKLPDEEWREVSKVIDFPDMSHIKNIAWDNRSGLLVFGVREQK